MWSEFLPSVISGLISSVLIGIYLHFRDLRLWGKTRKFFVSKIDSERTLIGFYILEVLNINVMDEDDSFKGYIQMADEITQKEISLEQFKRLYHVFRTVVQKIELHRARALAIPTFTPKDFHAADTIIRFLNSYQSTYSMCEPLEENDECLPLLKRKLAEAFKFIEGPREIHEDAPEQKQN